MKPTHVDVDIKLCDSVNDLILLDLLVSGPSALLNSKLWDQDNSISESLRNVSKRNHSCFYHLFSNLLETYKYTEVAYSMYIVLPESCQQTLTQHCL